MYSSDRSWDFVYLRVAMNPQVIQQSRFGCTVKEIRGNIASEKIIIKSKTGENEVPVRGVFIELGYVPNTTMFSRLVKMNREKRIIIDGNNQTNVPGLFAAGDVTNVNANQVVIAIGEGANAALSAYNYLLTMKA